MPASPTKVYPSIAMLELSNVPQGVFTADSMVKQSPIAMLRAGTVSGGKYIILIGGSVAAVDEAYLTGREAAGDACLDSLYLPDIHEQTYAAMLGSRSSISKETLGLFESPAISLTILAADRAVKGSDVSITEIRIGNQYSGKGFCCFNGPLESVQIAIDIACEQAAQRHIHVCTQIIPQLHEHMVTQLNGPSFFDQAQILHLNDGEHDVSG